MSGAGGHPAVSVVTPAWNAEATLGAAVASVIAQTRGDWEMLVVDDGSTDGTRARAEALAAAEPRLRVLGGARGGAAAARNAAIRAARGRFVAFLDADDLWRPEKLARQIGYMEATGAPFTFASVQRIDEAGRPLGTPAPAPARVDYARLLRGNVIPCQTAAYDRLHYGPVEMPPLARRQDYGLWLLLLARGGEAHGLPEVLADWRMRPGSLSSNKLLAAAGTWAVYREVAGLGRAAAALRLGGNLARAALKRLG
jgi:teichuronic acid biosynthesis glycosyltransferase TuaG